MDKRKESPHARMKDLSVHMIAARRRLEGTAAELVLAVRQ